MEKLFFFISKKVVTKKCFLNKNRQLINWTVTVKTQVIYTVFRIIDINSPLINKDNKLYICSTSPRTSSSRPFHPCKFRQVLFKLASKIFTKRLIFKLLNPSNTRNTFFDMFVLDTLSRPLLERFFYKHSKSSLSLKSTNEA